MNLKWWSYIRKRCQSPTTWSTTCVFTFIIKRVAWFNMMHKRRFYNIISVYVETEREDKGYSSSFSSKNEFFSGSSACSTTIRCRCWRIRLRWKPRFQTLPIRIVVQKPLPSWLFPEGTILTIITMFRQNKANLNIVQLVNRRVLCFFIFFIVACGGGDSDVFTSVCNVWGGGIERERCTKSVAAWCLGRRWPYCDGDDLRRRTHFRRPYEPGCHHGFCCNTTLSMETGLNLLTLFFFEIVR